MRSSRAKLLRRAASVLTRTHRNRPVVAGTDRPASIYRQLKKLWVRDGNVYKWQ